jgi:hypothetical protein
MFSSWYDLDYMVLADGRPPLVQLKNAWHFCVDEINYPGAIVRYPQEAAREAASRRYRVDIRCMFRSNKHL